MIVFLDVEVGGKGIRGGKRGLERGGVNNDQSYDTVTHSFRENEP